MDSAALQHDIMIFNSINKGRQLVLAGITLLIYEYFITLDQEVKFFWGGRWSPSRILYLSNRYLPPVIMALVMVCFNVEATLAFCDTAIRVVYGLSTIALFVIQGILVVRVFYLFSHSLIARIIIASSYITSIIVTIVLEFNVLHGRPLLTPLSALGKRMHLVGCPVHTMTLFWHLFLPAFSLHSILYIFTLIRVLSCEDSPQALLIRRLHRDGGFFYLVVIASVGYTEIGAGLSDVSDVNIPAVFANFVLVATSISISRVMLSFHELAHHIRNDPARRVVSGIPLNRVNYTKKINEREEHIIVGGATVTIHQV